MLSEWIEKIINLAGGLGYWGVFVSSLGLAPAEIVIAMTAASVPDRLVEISVAAGLGEAVGAIPMYLIGYFFSKKDIFKFLDGKGKFFNISEKSYDDGYDSIQKYGSLYIIFSRFIPGVRIISSLVAGYVKQGFLIFFVSVFTGSFIYAYIFSFIGSEIGISLTEVKKLTNIFSWVGIILLIVITFVLPSILKRKNGEK